MSGLRRGKVRIRARVKVRTRLRTQMVVRDTTSRMRLTIRTKAADRTRISCPRRTKTESQGKARLMERALERTAVTKSPTSRTTLDRVKTRTNS
jgi:hypothetical protein